MSLHRFFLDSQVLSEERDEEFLLDLSRDDLKHSKVIRLKPNEHIAVIDAKFDYFECKITRIDAEGIYVSITQHLDPPKENFTLTLFQGVAKGERFEFVLKHGCELGVSAFVPLICERCVVKLDQKKIPAKMKRWSTIIRNAAKQAGLNSIPVIENPLDLASASDVFAAFDLVLICWEEVMDSLSIRQAIDKASLKSGAKVAIVVGPEGGISDDEVSLILGASDNARLVSLGPTILRTETAGIVSCALALDKLREELC